MSDRRPPGPKLQRGRKDFLGRKLCCHCDAPLTGRQISWCGDECALRYRIRKGDQNAARRWLELVAKQHRCERCDTAVSISASVLEVAWTLGPKARAEFLRSKSWEADHRIPIVEGGPLEPENLRTLCVPCHRIVTKELRSRLAARRRLAKEQGE